VADRKTFARSEPVRDVGTQGRSDPIPNRAKRQGLDGRRLRLPASYGDLSSSMALKVTYRWFRCAEEWSGL
jgi:hypothetical protein